MAEKDFHISEKYNFRHALMEAFYSAWLGGNTIHGAFAKAQKKMRKKYKEVYQWGAWVLVE